MFMSKKIFVFLVVLVSLFCLSACNNNKKEEVKDNLDFVEKKDSSKLEEKVESLIFKELSLLESKSDELNQCVENTMRNCLNDEYMRKAVNSKDASFCDKIQDQASVKNCKDIINGNIEKVDIPTLDCDKKETDSEKLDCKNGVYMSKAIWDSNIELCKKISRIDPEAWTVAYEFAIKTCENSVNYKKAVMNLDSKYCELIHTDIDATLKDTCMKWATPAK